MGSSPLSIKHSTMIGAAGEYYVLARLSLLGKIAAQARRGVPNADIVVSSVDGDRLCAVQVKTRRGKGTDHGWHMSKKHEALTAGGLFYAFVDFVSTERPAPVTYLVPSAVVAQVLEVMHRTWLFRPGKNGHQRKDSDFRRFMPDYTINCGDEASPYTRGWLDPYKEAWHLLP